MTRIPWSTRRSDRSCGRGYDREKSGGASWLVLEVSPAREEHRHAVLVGRLDHHRVAQRAARLDDRSDAGSGGDLDAVGEREVRVGCHDGEARILTGLADSDLDRDHARELTRPDAHAR